MLHDKNKIFPLLGVDIGGTKVAVSIGSNEGDLIDSCRIDNYERRSEDVIPEIIQACRSLIHNYKQLGAVRALGIGAPGPIDIPKGLILNPYNLPYWRDIPIQKILTEALNIPIFFDNDANAAGIAEWRFGSGKGCTDMIYISLSTGIGGGIIVNNHPLRGATFEGAEMHFSLDPNGPMCACGIKGCYEAFCGGRAVAKRVQQEIVHHPESILPQLVHGNLSDIDMRVIVSGVVKNDRYAQGVWDQVCFRNAQAIGGLITLFNPQCVVLGTLANATGDLFMTPFMHYLPQFVPYGKLNCKITTSALGCQLGELSGIALALSEYERLLHG